MPMLKVKTKALEKAAPRSMPVRVTHPQPSDSADPAPAAVGTEGLVGRPRELVAA
jgi:hypothetical protein